ncbi:Phosphonoacetaldehyde hydrolase [Termitomyces sp. J132]|nr:Phosphonoacetaldehyde hydrolase [Termitomyces sp. J132]
MVGCPTDVFQKVQPFLESCAERIVHCGDTGAGHAVKAVNNIIMGTNLVIASEGLSILAKYGVSPAAALAIINESSGRSWATQDRMQNYILPGTYDYGFQLSLLEKDMSTALQLASGRASQTLSATADHTRLAEVVAKLQSTTLVTHKQSSDKQPKSPSMRALGIKLVVFDCAGTIIDEGGLVYNVLKQVMRRAPGGCITYTEEEFNRWHGGNKIELLRFFGYRAGMSEEEVQGMYTDFLSSLQTGYFSSENKGAVTLIPGVIELFYELRRAGIKVCLNTGYPHSIADRLIQVLELEDKIDGLVVAEDVGMGRPYPYMIQHLARLHNIVDMRHIVKLGDSVRDIEEGRFSGCGLVVGVLTGADSAEDHIKAGADLVLKSVADLSV